jgi:aspartate kinase
MRGTPGVAARVFGAVARAGVNVIAIAQGSSELNISFCVNETDQAKAVRAVHDEFHSSQGAPPPTSPGSRAALVR